MSDRFGSKIGIGGHLAAPPLPHHRAYGSVPRRLDRVKRGQERRGGEDRDCRNTGCAAPVGRPDVRTCARNQSASGSNRRVELWQATLSQFFEAVGAVLPLPPEVRSEPSADPCLQVGEHSWGLAEAKVSAPPEKVWREILDHLRQAVPSCPAGHIPDLRLELGERLWRDAPLAPVIRDAESQEFTLLRSRHRAFRLVDLQLQLVGQEPAHRSHDPLPGAATANIDVAVAGVAAEAETPAGQFLVEIVEHEIAQEGREHSPNAKGNFHRRPGVCRLTVAARGWWAALVLGSGSSAGSVADGLPGRSPVPRRTAPSDAGTARPRGVNAG